MKISTPEAQGVPSKALERFVDKLKEQKLPVHSILMARHGHMIMEAYYQPYDKEKLHRMFSETKSYTSLGIGLLVSDGVIRLEDKICQYFPEYLPLLLLQTDKQSFQIRHSVTIPIQKIVQW